jgi:hypothetical protein
MSNVVTAKEFSNANIGKMSIYDMLIAFAQLHCKAQQRQIIADLRKEHTSDSHIESIVNNAYPLIDIN